MSYIGARQGDSAGAPGELHHAPTMAVNVWACRATYVVVLPALLTSTGCKSPSDVATRMVDGCRRTQSGPAFRTETSTNTKVVPNVPKPGVVVAGPRRSWVSEHSSEDPDVGEGITAAVDSGAEVGGIVPVADDSLGGGDSELTAPPGPSALERLAMISANTIAATATAASPRPGLGPVAGGFGGRVANFTTSRQSARI